MKPCYYLCIDKYVITYNSDNIFYFCGGGEGYLNLKVLPLSNISVLLKQFYRETSFKPHHINKVVIKYFYCRIFEQRCIKIMDRMFEENKERTLDVLDCKTSVWGIKSKPLTFAHENLMYDVIAHTCSQQFMNNKWYSGLPAGKWAYCKVNTGLSFSLLPS